eukprot:2046258-Pyramimonas_sp.AAC.1
MRCETHPCLSATSKRRCEEAARVHAFVSESVPFDVPQFMPNKSLPSLFCLARDAPIYNQLIPARRRILWLAFIKLLLTASI